MADLSKTILLPLAVSKVTSLLNVVAPPTLTLSKFVCPSTSKSPFKSESPFTTAPVDVTVPLNTPLVKLVVEPKV